MSCQVRVSAGDPAARRYIISFKAELIEIQGRPWVRLVVVGQSFMLHQIRWVVQLHPPRMEVYCRPQMQGTAATNSIAS